MTWFVRLCPTQETSGAWKLSWQSSTFPYLCASVWVLGGLQSSTYLGASVWVLIGLQSSTYIGASLWVVIAELYLPLCICVGAWIAELYLSLPWCICVGAWWLAELSLPVCIWWVLGALQSSTYICASVWVLGLQSSTYLYWCLGCRALLTFVHLCGGAW